LVRRASPSASARRSGRRLPALHAPRPGHLVAKAARCAASWPSSIGKANGNLPWQGRVDAHRRRVGRLPRRERRALPRAACWRPASASRSSIGGPGRWSSRSSATAQPTAARSRGREPGALWKLPVVFVCKKPLGLDDGQRALGRRRLDREARRGLRIPGDAVDGNDVLAVQDAVARAAARARAGEGPSLVEAHTIRWVGHSRRSPDVPLEGRGRGGAVARTRSHDSIGCCARWRSSTTPTRGGSATASSPKSPYAVATPRRAAAPAARGAADLFAFYPCGLTCP